MRIQTLKDVKNALKDVPDELLSNLWFGTGEMAEETIQMVAGEGESEFEFPQVWETVKKKYPQLLDLNKLIKNICKAQSELDGQEGDEDYLEISSEDKVGESNK